uniref:Uncharacterized protein n=1 Tax=Cacopsylla melanoneura TaxID=428564 RepID=A0A8D8Z6N9_9HEMI
MQSYLGGTPVISNLFSFCFCSISSIFISIVSIFLLISLYLSSSFTFSFSSLMTLFWASFRDLPILSTSLLKKSMVLSNSWNLLSHFLSIRFSISFSFFIMHFTNSLDSGESLSVSTSDSLSLSTISGVELKSEFFEILLLVSGLQ